jgi:thioredoxin reductase
MHGYLSRDGLPPKELIEIGRREVAGYGGHLVDGVAAELAPDGRGSFWVVLDGGQRISARRLLVTSGLRDELPDIPGLRDRWARDVLHCPYCHGHQVADRQLGVLGGATGAVRYAQIVRQWTENLTFFTPPHSLTNTERSELTARGIIVAEGTVTQLVIRDDKLHGIELDNGSVLPCDALFVPPRFVPNNQLLAGLGCSLDVDGWVVADPTGRTSIPGAWVAGNVVDPRAQAITAAGAGSAAAIAINADLVDDDVRNAVRDLQHGLVP